MLTRSVYLNDAELLALGKALKSCDVKGDKREKIEAECDEARERIFLMEEKARLSPDMTWAERNLLASMVWGARKKGEFKWTHKEIIICDNCKASYSYAKYPRNSRHHRKGETNYKKRIKCWGYHTPGGTICSACMAKFKEHIIKWLEGEKVEIAKYVTGEEPKWKRYGNRKCTKCGWEGHEGEMRKKPTLMGGGTYHAGCPNCKAENMLFLTPIDRADGYVVVPNKTEEKKA